MLQHNNAHSAGGNELTSQRDIYETMADIDVGEFLLLVGFFPPSLTRNTVGFNKPGYVTARMTSGSNVGLVIV